MKKLLIFLSLIVISSQAYANTVSVQPFISNSDVTIARLETQRQTFQNVLNGNIEGGAQNIKQGSITSYDLATAINPVQRWKESFNNFTYNGMLAPTSGTLSSTTTAGVSYINGVRVETSATAHTYTASKDTYVYINAGGFFDYTEVANGASAPSTPANDLLLFKAVTSGTAVTTVSDLRATSIQFTVNNSNFAVDYRDQAFVSVDSTTATHIEPGSVAIGNANYTNTIDTSSKILATPGNWIEGSAPNIKNLRFYVYAYNNAGSTYDFKYSSADPVYSDTSLNTGGTLRYYTSGGTTYRALAWISGDTSSLIQTNAFSNFKDTSTSNSVTVNSNAVATGSTTMPYDDTIPTNTEGDEYLNLTFRPTNINHRIRIDVSVSVSNGNGNKTTVALYKNNQTSAFAAKGIITAGTNASMQFCFTAYTTAADLTPIVFRLRAGSDSAGTMTINGETSARLFGGVQGSTMTATEVEG